MKEKKYNTCSKCKGTGRIMSKIIEKKDNKKIISIMKKYDLNQLKLAKILGISQSAVSTFLANESKIKSVYFDRLKSKGYT